MPWCPFPLISNCWATQKFVDASPIKVKAFIAAVDEASDIVANDPKQAAEIYVRVTKEKNGDFSDAREWPPMGDKSLSGYERKKLFHNEGGQLFSEQAARHGLDSPRDGRGVAVVDLDGDGRLDLFVANAGAPPNLYRNVLPPGPHWVELALEGTRSNRDAIGAVVRIYRGKEVLTRQVHAACGYLSQSSRTLHFGLGEAGKKIDSVEIAWPSGARQVLPTLEVNRRHDVVEPAQGDRP